MGVEKNADSSPQSKFEMKTFILIPAILFLIVSAGGQTSKSKRHQPVKKTTTQTKTPAAPNRMAEDAGSPDVSGRLAVNSTIRVRLVKEAPADSVSGVIIYLLDQSLDLVLTGAKFPPAGQKSAANAFAEQFTPDAKDFQKTFAVIAPHIKQSLRTDAEGRVILENVAPGQYCLFAVERDSKGIVAWNMPVKVERASEIEVALSRDDSFYKR